MINDLDRFVFDFIKILRKYTPYVIVSGYTAILFGRSRATEDVDILIPKLGKEKLDSLFMDLSKNEFFCMNTNSTDEIFSYLNEGYSVRFLKGKGSLLNIELKFLKNNIDEESFKHSLKVLIADEELLLSCVELQIAYKRIVLGSLKDLEDAKHLESVFKNYLNKEKLKYYENMVNLEWNKSL